MNQSRLIRAFAGRLADFLARRLKMPLCSFQYSASHGREISSGSIDEELNHADP
jgi:hypothetical protein